MRTLFIRLLLLSLLFLYCKQATALEPFIPSNGNPIQLQSNFEGWQESGFRTGNVIYENNEYKLWYSSFNNNLKIAYATSTTGKEWLGVKLYDFYEDRDYQDPSTIKIDDKYSLYFTTTENGSLVINRIHSNDGVSFNKESLINVIQPTENWEQGGVAGPSVYFESSKIFLFYSALNSNWNAGLAISTDGTTFHKCNSNPFLTYDVTPSSLIKLNNTYYLFFHSPNGIESIETDKLGCDSVWKNRTVQLPFGYFPYVIKKGNELQMFYSTNAGGNWRINLATSQLPQEKKPVIIIPGMFASWNKEALFYGTKVDQSAWKMNPIVKEYSGLESTLQNAGYQGSSDYYVFNYDWRKSLEDNAGELNSYINSLNLPEKPVIIGHSLGGLVGRIYAQKYGTAKIDKLVTAGSPHQGAAQAYGAIEAGEVDKSDIWMWLSEKLILQLYRDGIKTDRQIVSEKLPVIQNLLPTYDFLSKNGQTISVSDMKIRNNMLASYQSGFNSIFGSVRTVAGEKGETVAGYVVGNRTTLDQLLDYYPDGRPVSASKSIGDYTVTSISAKAGHSPTVIAKDHGELIYTKEGITAILQGAGLSIDPANVVEGKKTILTPSLIFLMLSPATVQVQGNGSVYNEQDGVTFIENAQSGGYSIEVKGKEKGKYSLLIGQITENNDMWTRIEGEITKDPPESQTDTYEIRFNAADPGFPVGSATTLLDELIAYLKDTNKTLKKADITKALTNLNNAKNYYTKNNRGMTKSLLSLSQQQLLIVYPKTAMKDRPKVLYAIEKLEYVYDLALGSYNNGVIKSRLQKNLKENQALIPRIQNFLLVQKNRGKNIQANALLVSNLQDKLDDAQKAIGQNKLNYAEILMKTITTLSGAALKL